MSLNAKMTAIADEIRAATGGTDLLTLDDIAENVPRVYEVGKKAGHDAFWDAFQNNGNRTNYAYAFMGEFWNEKTFKPKYPIAPKGSAYNAFYEFNNNFTAANREKIDMSKFEFDFSAVTDARVMFNDARIENLFCDFRNVTSLHYTFNRTRYGSVDNLTLRVSEKCTSYERAFYYQYDMKTLIFTEDSVIAATMSVQESRNLSRASIESIVNALSETSAGKTLTLSNAAVTTAFGSVDNAKWQALVATKPNWTISLI